MYLVYALTSTDKWPVAALYCNPNNSSGADLVLQHDDAESERARLQASPPPPRGVTTVDMEGLASMPDIGLANSSFGS